MRRILLVDDDQSITQGLEQMILRNLTNVQVDTCSDGLQAWEKLQYESCDLMITDVMMPGLDGIELLTRLSQAGRAPYSIVISGYDQFELVRGAMKQGAQDYLLKPIHQEELLKTVSQVLALPSKAQKGAANPPPLQPAAESAPDHFFDIQLPLPDGDCGMETLLDDASEAAMRLELSTLQEKLDLCLACAQHQGATREYLIKVLVSWYYSLMEQMPGMIRIASRYKLTEYDLTEGLKNAPTLSAMLLTLRETMGIYLQELEKTRDRRGMQIERVKEYIRENLSESVQIAEAAQLIDVHPNYLSTIFKDYTGVSFRDYLRQERIQKAMDLIRNTDRKLYEIAECVGYQDPAHFSRAFKQVTGISPQSLIKKREG